MTAKEYMKEAKILLRRIERKRREAENIRICERAPSSPSFSDMPKTVTHNPHRMTDSINRAIDLDKEADLVFDELAALKTEFAKSILILEDPDERDLLYKYYIEFKKWDVVFNEMAMSESVGYRVRRRAMAKLEKRQFETVKDSCRQ